MTSEMLPPRPKRKFPTLWAIARHWADRDVFGVDLDLPHCFACGAIANSEGETPGAQWNGAGLERAHLADRCTGGLDGPQNMVPLCTLCHRIMPVFGFGEGPAAIQWVKESGGWPGFVRELMKERPPPGRGHG